MTAQVPAASTSTSRRRWVILLVLAGSQMLVQLDVTIINTALPAIKRAFEMSESQSLWVADAYMVIFGGLLLLAHEWATRGQTYHSYELLARYVKPQFQGSLVNLTTSQAWATDKLAEIKAKQKLAMDRAKRDYLSRR